MKGRELKDLASINSPAEVAVSTEASAAMSAMIKAKVRVLTNSCNKHK